MKRILHLLPTLLLALTALTACLTTEVDPSDTGDVVRVGDALPAFEAPLPDGTVVTPATLAGRPAVVVLFTTSCSDCRRALPVLQGVALDYGAAVPFLCISRAEGLASVEAYWQANGLTLPFSACDDRSLYDLFARHTVPRVYVADAAGIVRAQFTESLDADALRQVLDALLGEE